MGEPRVLHSDFLEGELPEGQHLALLLLNWTLPPLTAHLWQRAAVRVCADGGANRLYDELPAMLAGQAPDAVRAAYLPSAIRGDMDSIRPEVLDFYRQRGVVIDDLSGDQDSTDLQKCVDWALQHAREQRVPPEQLVVVAIGALGGRLDHTLSALSTLHAHRHVSIVLLGDGNLARLVPAGASLIRPNRRMEGPSCGLVPVAGAAVATSSGLRWDLANLEMRFGGLVSTSNAIEADEVRVQSDTDLVWTTRLRAEATPKP